MAIFHLFFVRKIGFKYVFQYILERKNTFLDNEKQEVQKVERSAFQQSGQSMVLMKNWQFLHFFLFKARQDSIRCIRIFQNGKEPFQTIKRTSQKKSKNWDFLKRDSPWSWLKNCNCFIPLMFSEICQENVFHDILKKKNLI